MSDDINGTSNPRCGAHFTAQTTVGLAADSDRQRCVVLITGSRGVSDPRTDPGVRVRGPRVGSLTSPLLSGAGRSRGERRRAIVYRY